MRLVDLIPDADVLCALEPDELALRMLPVLAAAQALTLGDFIIVVCGTRPNYLGQYGVENTARVEQAIREAWAWLEGVSPSR